MSGPDLALKRVMLQHEIEADCIILGHALGVWVVSPGGLSSQNECTGCQGVVSIVNGACDNDELREECGGC